MTADPVIIWDDLDNGRSPATDAVMVAWFREMVASGRLTPPVCVAVPREHEDRYHEAARACVDQLRRVQFIPRRCEVTIIDDLDPYHPDAHTVRFSEMSAEAEAELAAWDEMLHGRNRT